MNQVYLVGQVVKELEYVEFEKQNRMWLINLEVTSDEDLEKRQVEKIPLVLSAKLAMIKGNHLKIGRTIGVKGLLRSTNGSIEIHVSKIVFLEKFT